MRTRDEIVTSINKSKSTIYDRQVIIELLLDIRELLAQPTLHKDFDKLLNLLSTPQE